MKYPIKTLGERMREILKLNPTKFPSLKEFTNKWTGANEKQAEDRFNRKSNGTK